MGVFILLIIVAILIYVFANSEESSRGSFNGTGTSSTTGSNSSTPGYYDGKVLGINSYDALQVRVVKNRTNGFEVFDVQIKGSLRVKTAFDFSSFHVTMFDVTKDEAPVICALPQMCYEDLNVFYFSTKPDTFGRSYPRISGWTTLTKIPIEVLTFAHSKNIKLEMVVELVCGGLISDRYTANKTTLLFDFYNKDTGYIDKADKLREFRKKSVELAANMIKIDGSIDPSEKDIIFDWIELNSRDEDETKELRHFFIDELQAVSSDVSILFEDIIKNTETSDRYVLLELLVRLSVSDGTIDDSEEELLDIYCDKLDIDKEKFGNLKKKFITSEMIEDASNVLIKFEDGMTKEDKKAYLRKEYKNWSNKVTHSDREIRMKAEKMLDVIAEQRSKL